MYTYDTHYPQHLINYYINILFFNTSYFIIFYYFTNLKMKFTINFGVDLCMHIYGLVFEIAGDGVDNVTSGAGGRTVGCCDFSLVCNCKQEPAGSVCILPLLPLSSALLKNLNPLELPPQFSSFFFLVHLISPPSDPLRSELGLSSAWYKHINSH